MSEGVLPVFIKLLRSQDQDIQYYCAAALSNLAVDGKISPAPPFFLEMAFTSFSPLG